MSKNLVEAVYIRCVGTDIAFKRSLGPNDWMLFNQKVAVIIRIDCFLRIWLAVGEDKWERKAV